MICTIFESNGRKELHYGEQNHAGVKGVTYQVSQECIEIIRRCRTEEIQKVIVHIESVSELIGYTK